MSASKEIKRMAQEYAAKHCLAGGKLYDTTAVHFYQGANALLPDLRMVNRLLEESENALTDYIDRLEKQPMTKLNYGRSVVIQIREALAKLEKYK